MMLPPSGEIHLSPNFPNLNHAVPRHGSLPNVSAGVNHVLVMNKGLLILVGGCSPITLTNWYTYTTFPQITLIHFILSTMDSTSLLWCQPNFRTIPRGPSINNNLTLFWYNLPKIQLRMFCQHVRYLKLSQATYEGLHQLFLPRLLQKLRNYVYELYFLVVS